MSFRLNKVPRKFLSPENWAPRILLPLSLFIGMGFSLFAGFTPAAARFGTVELEQAEALLDRWDCNRMEYCLGAGENWQSRGPLFFVFVIDEKNDSPSRNKGTHLVVSAWFSSFGIRGFNTSRATAAR